MLNSFFRDVIVFTLSFFLDFDMVRRRCLDKRDGHLLSSREIKVRADINEVMEPEIKK